MLNILLAIYLCQLGKAALVWNTGGEVAIFISIAIPIDLPTRHVFLSYNFEANYRLPRTWHKERAHFRRDNGTHISPINGPVDDFEDYYDDYDEEQQHKRKKPKPPKHKKPKPLHHKPPKRRNKHKLKTKHKPKPSADDDKNFFAGYPDEVVARHRRENSLLSRSKFYEILSRRFEQHGFGSADSCLLRLICEANGANMGEINGVLGSLMHVMFSPSSSYYEALPMRYYNAEFDGQQDKCEAYHAKCSRSVLDLITRPLIDYISNKRPLL
ncbi:uncharacterized protein LOC6560767 [Drosophila grimshawi]|uniref:uncharacterized protein LOC6560767 n=1 Tax=Drosophila grimshawi TaxID=7222 RepID=UPI000C86E9B3|nr:uncharacterized protein LOC6560767 [Drosophila grimshawi]